MSEKKQKAATQVDAVLQATEMAAKQEATKQKQADLKMYDKKVKGMSFRQLRSELRQQAKTPRDTCLLTAGIASVMLTVLENTKTHENPFAKLNAYPR